MITVEKVKELAMKNYETGGDFIIECWSDEEIQKAINKGDRTEKDWLDTFETLYYNYLDIAKTAW